MDRKTNIITGKTRSGKASIKTIAKKRHKKPTDLKNKEETSKAQLSD